MDKSQYLSKIIDLEGDPFCPKCFQIQTPNWLADSNSGVFVSCLFCPCKWYMPADDYLIEILRPEFPYVWAWGNTQKYPVLGKRKGHACRVIVRGAQNSALIEFEDGYRVITSRNGLRKRKSE